VSSSAATSRAAGSTRQALEHRRAFRRTVKWRTGSEARISTLKRQYGWDRTHLDDIDGAGIWTGHGVLAHNLVKISALGELTPQPTKISNGSAQPAHSAAGADRTATSIRQGEGRRLGGRLCGRMGWSHLPISPSICHCDELPWGAGLLNALR